jgi:hypothetical protein
VRQVAIAALAFAAGCAGASAPPATSGSSAGAGAAPAPVAFDDAHWGKFHSTRFELSLGLPDGHAWRIDDHRSPWLVATHAATESTMRVRAWSESELASNDRCLATARSWDASIPELDRDRPVDDRVVPVRGSDIGARLVAGIRPDVSGAVGGWVVLVGASVRRCLLVVYTTRAAGTGVEQAIGDRLATIAQGLATTLALDRTLEVPRERVERPR